LELLILHGRAGAEPNYIQLLLNALMTMSDFTLHDYFLPANIIPLSWSEFKYQRKRVTVTAKLSFGFFIPPSLLAQMVETLPLYHPFEVFTMEFAEGTMMDDDSAMRIVQALCLKIYTPFFQLSAQPYLAVEFVLSPRMVPQNLKFSPRDVDKQILTFSPCGELGTRSFLLSRRSQCNCY
jgi:hypothetical protein